MEICQEILDAANFDHVVSNTAWFKTTLVRAFRRLAVGLIASFVLLIVILRIETYRFQHKAERLMEDFQSINLRGSSWADAGRLIRQWREYGSYQGDCTAFFCLHHRS